MNVVFGNDADRQLIADASCLHFPSSFNFLKATNGFRPGKVHLIIGLTGGGKSTLTRSLVGDLICTGLTVDNMLIWLSEEDVSEFKIGMSRTGIKSMNGNECHVFSEHDYDNEQEALLALQEALRGISPRILLLDNITTSCLYMDKRPDHQANFAKILKKIARDMNIPIVIIAHTRAEIIENINRFINSQDIRGGKSITNMAQYIYVLQRFKIDEEYYSTIRIEKARDFVIENSMFRLFFDKERQVYIEDLKIEYKEFKEWFDKRNKL